MDLYGKKGNNKPQITIILVLELLILAFSYWVLFLDGYNSLFSTNFEGLNSRHILLFAFNCIVFIRISFTLTVFIKRQIPWEEAFSVPMAFGVYYIGFALFGYSSADAINWADYLGVVLFLIGSFLNTHSELMRHIWKKDPANKGKLYTQGLFKYSMHINYFGDLLWVAGYAFVCHNVYSFSIVAFIFSFFAFYNIPKLDKYLAEKYGDAFVAYAKSTKKFIPFIY